MSLLSGCDSVTPATMPLGFDVYAAYVTGYDDYQAMVEAFPGKKYIGISTSVAPTDCYDVEEGGGVNADCVAFFNQSPHPNLIAPMFYADLNNMPSLVETLEDAGIARARFLLWVADWDGETIIPSGYDGVQYASFPGYDADMFDSSCFPGPVFPKDQTGTVYSNTTHLSAPVKTTDGGLTWIYTGGAKPGVPNQSGTVHSNTTGGSAAVVTVNGGLTWTFVR
jgi:hypothetical protein